MWERRATLHLTGLFLKEQPELLDDHGSSHSQCERAIVKYVISEDHPTVRIRSPWLSVGFTTFHFTSAVVGNVTQILLVLVHRELRYKLGTVAMPSACTLALGPFRRK
jgi:hypothetical protein